MIINERKLAIVSNGYGVWLWTPLDCTHESPSLAQGGKRGDLVVTVMNTVCQLHIARTRAELARHGLTLCGRIQGRIRGTAEEVAGLIGR